MAADLHIHSTASDGCSHPVQLVDLANSRGLSALAITDHDTTQGVLPAVARGQEIGLLVLPGVEISCEDDAGREMHILGYGIDPNHQGLADRLTALRDSRRRRLEQIVQRLRSVNIHLSLDRIQAIAGDGSVGRPHVADAMVERGYVNNRVQAFQGYLAKGRPGYVPREKTSPSAAIALIASAAGVAIWAHPECSGLADRLPSLVHSGLAGIEVWHPDHSEQQVCQLLQLARLQQLLVTGGSDFHCTGSGSPLGSYVTPDWAVQNLLQVLSDRGSQS